MEEVELSKKRKFQTDQSDSSSLLPLSKHACFDNATCSNNTTCITELDYSLSCVNSTSMECENEVETKEEESSGSCSESKLISFESNLDSIYGIKNLEEYSDKDIENILYLDQEEEEAKECNYVLSSGRWNVSQETTLHGPKKPTIDQEFEQYFSTLML
ncbi:unnamed protein product [Cochlearia groenlandica]